MPDQEKVIKGLECCGTNRSCIGCPYVGELFDGCYGACISYLNRDALELLKELPEIIRCKDCRYSEECIPPCDDRYCVFYDERHDGDWYCADGKRR